MRKSLLLFFILFSTQFFKAQNAKNTYREKFIEGNHLMVEKNYPLALVNFKEAYLIDSSSANINYKLGVCYLQSGSQKYKAVYHLEKAVQNTTHNYSEDRCNTKPKLQNLPIII
jgi:tetratricopeptide (TPR) repeat protein